MATLTNILLTCGFLLRENGSILLRENGGGIIREDDDCDLVSINKNNATLTNINKN